MDNRRRIQLENEFLRIAFQVDRGCDLTEFLYRPKNIDFLWTRCAPIRAVTAAAPKRSDLRFLDQFGDAGSPR